jgi:hypothetical protein
MTDSSDRKASPKLSRRKFLTGSAATAAGTAVASSGISLLSERAEAFFNMGAFWKKPVGSGQTSNGYTIGQSLRFNRGSSTYLARTFATPTNNNKFTLSLWMKLSSNADYLRFFGAGSNSSAWWVNAAGQIVLEGGSGDPAFMYTNSLYRDFSAWMHVVVWADGGGTGYKLYVNGSLVSSAAVGTGTAVNSAIQHFIGGSTLGSSVCFDGYMAEINFIDGQALDASSFGQFDTVTGQWIPKSCTVSDYGKNGFYLKFSNSSSLGDDSAPIFGNHTSANNWTPNGFATQDQVLDSPTNNFCTWNQLNSSGNALSGGNLNVSISTTAANGTAGTKGTFAVNSGKYYWEVLCVSTPNTSTVIGVVDAALKPNADVGYINGDSCVLYWSQAAKTLNGAGTNPAYGTTYSTNDVIGVALDATGGTITFYKNGASQGALSLPSNSVYYAPCVANEYPYADSLTANFGQGGQSGLTYDAASGGRFKYTPPAGFKALSTANLSAPSVKNSSQYFSAVTYTGTGATNARTSGFQPDLVWIKTRSTGTNHAIYDSVRGANKRLSSDLTNTEVAATTDLMSFDTSGFTLGTDAGNYVNTLNLTYVAWCWKKGATPGFDVQLATGASATTWTHSLGAAPAFAVIKDRNASNNWCVYHQSITGDYFLRLNTADAKISVPGMFTSSGTNFVMSGSAPIGDSIVAYLWAEVPGFSKFGIYAGNQSSDGPFIYCGFKPAYVLVKNVTTTACYWEVHDNQRGSFNANGPALNPNLPGNEYVGEYIDFLSNGFKWRSAGSGINNNNNSDQYIFAAFAEAPFKYANAR